MFKGVLGASLGVKNAILADLQYLPYEKLTFHGPRARKTTKETWKLAKIPSIIKLVQLRKPVMSGLSGNIPNNSDRYKRIEKKANISVNEFILPK